MARRLIDITGAVFGRLTVIARGPNTAKGSAWLCRCRCGTEKVVTRTNLVCGNVASCGCLSRELSAVRGAAREQPLRPCAVSGCTATVEKGGRGYCARHAQRMRRHGDPLAVTPYLTRRMNNAAAQVARRPAKATSYRKLLGRHEHRVVMERHLGRPLRSDEIVHHIDGNRHNNAIDNLQVVTAEEHARIHARDMQRARRRTVR